MPKPILETGLVVGNTFDKYCTRNPMARKLVQGFLRTFDELVQVAGGERVLEVGCGEGELSIRMAASGRTVLGPNISSRMVAEAVSRAEDRGVRIGFSQSDLFELNPEDGTYDLVVCCEVPEHLEVPEAAIRHLKTLTKRHLLVSVPREPLWRILNMVRGRYLGALGNTPGHLQHWSRESFLRFLRPNVEIEAARSPLPWTMAPCRIQE